MYREITRKSTENEKKCGYFGLLADFQVVVLLIRDENGLHAVFQVEAEVLMDDLNQAAEKGIDCLSQLLCRQFRFHIGGDAFPFFMAWNRCVCMQSVVYCL